MGVPGVTHTSIRARRGRLGSAAAVTALLLVSGCTAQPGDPVPPQPTSIAISESPGWPEDAPYPEREWEGPIGPIAWWGEDRETITVISYGSSSCPFVATEISAPANNLVVAVFVKPTAGACTDDLAAHTHVLARPSGLSDDLITVAEVQWREPRGEDEDWVQEFEIIVDDPEDPWPSPPPSAAVDEYPGLPAGIPAPEMESVTPDSVLAYWLSPPLEFATERELTIVTFGSSSCPVIPTAVDAGLSSSAIGVTLEQRNPAGVCTADLAPFTSVLAIPLEPAATAMSVEFTFLTPDVDNRTVTVDIVDLAPPR